MAKATKRGRKPRPFVTDGGKGQTIDGLRRRSDGRWVICATGKTFVEADEARAVAKFRAMGGDAGARFSLAWDERQLSISMPQLWRYVAEQIRARPQWVAEQTGDERLARLDTIKAPAKLPKLAELRAMYAKHGKGLAQERRKVLAAWDDFTKTAKVAGLADVTPTAAIDYRNAIHARDKSGKYEAHIFNRVKRVLRVAQDHLDCAAIDTALAALARLKPSKTQRKAKPRPISPDDYKRLLAASTGDDRAMLLLMMNAALYLQEAVDVRWDQIDLADGFLVARRRKTGECIRAAVLWAETREALAGLTRRGDTLFYSEQGTPLTVSGAGKRFRKLRAKAGLTVEANQIRDGAASAVTRAKVSEQLLNVLLGHANGINDLYVERDPSLVADACAAVRARYVA